VVDDNDVDLRMLEAMLTENEAGPCFFRCATSLADAMESLTEQDFDVVVLDLNLPDSQGEQTLIELNKKFPLITIVVNTGAYEDEVGVISLRLGAQDFLNKGKYNSYTLNKSLLYAIERKRLELELKMAYDNLKDLQSQLVQAEKMRVVGVLASGIAHEVKNPLATILYGITYLSEKFDKNKEDIRIVFESMLEAINRANNIITDLLNFSGLTRLNKKMEDLKDVLEKAISLVRHELDKHHIKLIKIFDSNIPKIEIDSARIEQVMVNLLINAIFAMPDGGEVVVTSQIFILSTEDLKKMPELNQNIFYLGQTIIMIHVDDKGCGIPDNEIDKIFEPFFTTRRSRGGVGLGLAVSKNIMDIHGGQIFISNKKEGGVRATLVFSVNSNKGDEYGKKTNSYC